MSDTHVNRPGCDCTATQHNCRLVAVTGGPGAGKTAVLELVRRLFCQHVIVLPEAAGILYGGGFPRHNKVIERRAAQNAIYHVERQLERIATDEGSVAIALCDRGTIDGLAYWPDTEESYWLEVASSLEVELARYGAVIHLRTPAGNNGYNHNNPLRLETASEAQAIDERILALWSKHPRRTVIESSANFLEKVKRAISAIQQELPDCCRRSLRASPQI